MLSKVDQLVMALVARFRSEGGQALAEYGLILALIATVSIIALTALGLVISGTLDQVAECRI
jgi:Flp pilus assembly pilin Flp